MHGVDRARASEGGQFDDHPQKKCYRELLPLLEQVWRASVYLSGKLLRPILPALVTETHHGVMVAPPSAHRPARRQPRDPGPPPATPAPPSSSPAQTVLQRLYGLLHLQHNFFRPSASSC